MDSLVERKADLRGYIVGNGDRTKWRAWINGLPAWVDDPAEATRYGFRSDANTVHAEDEDAWCIVEYKDVATPSARITGDKDRENPVEGAPYGEGLIGRIDALEAENARRVGKVSEAQFAAKVRDLLALDGVEQCGWVTGPGRSGAIAAVYASHLLSIPFVPFGSFAGPECGRVLIVDTAALSGRTLRKAERKYRERNPLVWFGFNEPPVVRFWYEAPCPQIVRRPLESVPHG